MYRHDTKQELGTQITPLKTHISLLQFSSENAPTVQYNSEKVLHVHRIRAAFHVLHISRKTVGRISYATAGGVVLTAFRSAPGVLCPTATGRVSIATAFPRLRRCISFDVTGTGKHPTTGGRNFDVIIQIIVLGWLYRVS